jgi:hypothetical protein
MAGICLLLLRGVLLWVAVPLGIVAWILLIPWFIRHGVRLGQFLGWIDLNLCSALERTILRPMIPQPVAWTPIGDMSQVTHRIGVIDPA